MHIRPNCYFAREVAKNRPYTVGGESDGQSVLCVFHDTGEQTWIPYSWFD